MRVFDWRNCGNCISTKSGWPEVEHRQMIGSLSIVTMFLQLQLDYLKAKAELNKVYYAM